MTETHSAPVTAMDVPRHAALPRLSSRFGHRADPFGAGARLHAGIDMPGAHGTPVLASASGVVRRAGRAGGYGLLVEIDHGGGMATRYAHLARALVWPGMAVAQGQTIGLMGSTGRSTGNHLHFEVRRDGRPVDPLPLLSGAAPAPPVGPLAALVPHRSAHARALLADDAAGQDALP